MPLCLGAVVRQPQRADGGEVTRVALAAAGVRALPGLHTCWHGKRTAPAPSMSASCNAPQQLGSAVRRIDQAIRGGALRRSVVHYGAGWCTALCGSSSSMVQSWAVKQRQKSTAVWVIASKPLRRCRSWPLFSRDTAPRLRSCVVGPSLCWLNVRRLLVHGLAVSCAHGWSIIA